MGAQQSSDRDREGYAGAPKKNQRGAEHCPTAAYVDSLTNHPVYKMDYNDRCILNRDMVGATNGAGNHYVLPGPKHRSRIPVCDEARGWYFSPSHMQCVHQGSCRGVSGNMQQARMCCRDETYPVPYAIHSRHSTTGQPHRMVYRCQNPIPGYS